MPKGNTNMEVILLGVLSIILIFLNVLFVRFVGYSKKDKVNNFVFVIINMIIVIANFPLSILL